MEIRPAIHLILHILLPLLIAVALFRLRWRRAALIMLATMVVDLDHLLADPVYSPGRCSIGYHPMHSAPAMPLYAGLALLRKTRLAGIGLVLHMALDAGDCAWQRLET